MDASTAIELCRLCGNNVVAVRDGLCGACWKQVEGGIWEIESGYQLGRLPERPTRCVPGTPGKIAILAERRRRGETLFHPDDA